VTGTLRAWTLLLWGPLLWFAHFGFVYGAASLELTLRPVAGTASRLAIAAATVAALLLVAVAAVRAPGWSPGEPRGGLHGFWTSSTRVLCLISSIAIVYQALPALIVP
jgi:hypothetical protein